MSDIRRVHAALTILREGSVEKVAGVADAAKAGGGALKTLWRAAKGGASEAGRIAEPLVGETGRKAIKYLPHAALAYGGYKAYQSPTGQKLRYKYQLWKARRAQQRGY